MNYLALGMGVLLAVSLASGETKNRSLKGTWCIEEQNVSITFFDKDSVRVTDGGEEGINGVGTYQKMDSMFVAVLAGSDLVVQLGYTYDWTSDTTLAGRPLFVTLNGDSLEIPEQSITMKRCGGSPAKKQ